MKILKFLFAFLILCLVVVGLIVGSLWLFIDPNKLKPVIVEEVKKKTGYHLTIDGALSWSFYPYLGVKIDHMTLSIPNQSQSIADMRDIKIKMQLSQILHMNKKMEGDIKISNLLLGRLSIQDASLHLSWHNHILTVQPVVASFYSGTLRGSFNGRDFSSLPAWGWNIRLSDVQLKPLLDDLNPQSKLKVAGIANFTLEASAKGKTREQFLNSLSGKSAYRINKGIVYGIDLNYLVQSADALLNKETLPTLTNINQTDFDSLNGSADIHLGVVDTNDTELISSAFIVKTQGNINLISQVINFELRVNSQKDIKSKWEIPILITGNLKEPDIRLDMNAIQKSIAKEQIEKVKAKVQTEIQEHLPEKASQFLQNLLGK